MKPLKIYGGNALPPFRTEALAAALAMPPDQIKATFVYLLDLERPLDDRELAKVCLLLGGSCQPPAPAAAAYFVAPRKGTISPWSSRAGEILRDCGVAPVRRVERAVLHTFADAPPAPEHLSYLFDRMREGLYESLDDLFSHRPPARGRCYDLSRDGRETLRRANRELGLALSDEEVDYLYATFSQAGRNPTDTELVMFGQVNSEHCRHKIFNADWIIDGVRQEHTLFEMIRHTHARTPQSTLVAYKDNAGVMEGFEAAALEVDQEARLYRFAEDQLDIVMKAETHNHPTAIAPYPGASTGVGGEIRDEVATGTGARSKAGLSGIIVSNLRVPGFTMPWELERAEFPARLATPLSIMLEAPAGGASFGNEFGRPQLCGFFRTYEDLVEGRLRGYHKPILLAGGMGNIRRGQVHKKPVPPGALIVQLGGPSMLIGLGGGAASSGATTGSEAAGLDFDSVQRGNAEVERRCQEVIEACVAMGADNPIISIHDVGAGGLSNACPELIEATGATFDLRAVPCAEPAMSPMEIWCCESQERYVLAIAPQSRGLFESLCRREHCPVAFIGVARDDQRLLLNDTLFNDTPIDMDIRALLGKPPRMTRDVTRATARHDELVLDAIEPIEAFERILKLPAVADKSFLITGADRSATGLVHRDQMVGPYQLPVADCAVTITGHQACSGEAMATGERTPIALLDAPASGRMAVAEALQNIAGANIGSTQRVKLSANWMAACGEPGEDAALYDTVASVGLDFCPRAGLSIPVGKDSLSMHTVWQDTQGESHRQTAPLSLIVSAFAAVKDVRKTVTPDLKGANGRLLLLDLGAGANRLGAGALAQVYNQIGREPPDSPAPELLKAFFDAIQELVEKELLLAYHDRSDGGVAITLAEMAMAGGRGLEVDLPAAVSPLAALFSEELGAVLQVADDNLTEALATLSRHGLAELVHDIGVPGEGRSFRLAVGGAPVLATDITWLRRAWSALSFHMQALGGNPHCARQAYDQAFDAQGSGLAFELTYDPDEQPALSIAQRPRVAVLREQGSGGHTEMAAALTLAGFDAVDVHTNDLCGHPALLESCRALAVCGGFAYGDALGAASGWAHKILGNARLAEAFTKFFARPTTITLGVGNGAQLLTHLKELIPGAEAWPRLAGNLSGQFEARYVAVEVADSPSLLLRGMAGSRLPAAVAHAEGRAVASGGQIVAALRYINGHGQPTLGYPRNPDGSVDGLCGFTSRDGRATAMMPHPERGFRAVQLSYRPPAFCAGTAGPWFRLFVNAHNFCMQAE